MSPSLNKLPWYGQIGLFVGLALAGVCIFYAYYAVPAQATLRARQARLTTLHADISKGLAAARRLPVFKARVGELSARLDSLKPILPEQKDVADLLRRLQTMAVESHLTIRAVKPEATVSHALHVEWPISLELDGTYDNLAIFFDRINHFPRIIDVSDVDIQAKPKQEPGSTVTASCKATTFVLLDPAAVAAQAAKVAKAGAKKPAAHAAGKAN
jgi:type IV pilus assembly protein PilO